MKNERQLVLSEIAETIQTGPFGSQLHQSDYSEVGTPVVMPKDLIGGSISEASIARVSADHVARLSRHKMSPGDIVYSRRGDVGRCALVTPKEQGWLCGTGCLRVTIDPDKANPMYVFYYLQLPKTIAWVENHAVGATMLNLNTSILGNIPIRLPDIRIQNKVVSVISSYDDLIATNQKQIDLLEEAAQRLYKEWFCFKHTPATEKDDISDYLIKRGWKKSKIGDIFNTYLGGTPSREKKEFWEKGTIPWINSGEVNRLRIVKPSEMITEQALRKSATKLLPKHTTLVAITGATLGQVSFTEIETCANQSVVGIYDGQDIYNYYLYHFVSQHIGEIVAKATGGAQQHINKDIINDYSIILPPVNVIREYNPLVAPIFESIKVLLFQNIFLSEARDLMLKELIVNSDSR